ncbi:hypothetical protein LCGC14_0369620 [marine sediment metagenome]|uniref:Uncharacterized protein n=1 Tax=marine sediment metagenome TaxID=412755 RepID=A0A0F9WDZ2_9ZZZZ
MDKARLALSKVAWLLERGIFACEEVLRILPGILVQMRRGLTWIETTLKEL